MSRNGKPRRRQRAQEKPQILEEARQPNTTVAEVLRRHQLDATSFYRWEREAKAAMLEALGEKPRGRGDDKDREIERLKAELERKSRIIAEVVDENLALKGGSKSGRGNPVQCRCKAGSAGAGLAHASPHRVDAAPASSVASGWRNRGIASG